MTDRENGTASNSAGAPEEARQSGGASDSLRFDGAADGPRSGGQPELSGQDIRYLAAAVVLTLAGVVIQLIPGMKFLGQLCMAAAVGCVAWLGLCKWAERSRTGRLCKRVFQSCLCAGCVLFGALETRLVTQGHEDWSALPADAVIVLGAGVNGTVPSLALETRLDRAAAYLETHPDIPAVLTGGQGPGEDLPEAEAMYTALLDRGADASQLYREDKATSTAENFRYAKEILDGLGIDTETAYIAVVTNDFHIYRAKLLADRQGIQMLGIPAELPYGWLTVNYYIREAFALVKSAAFDW